MPNDPVPDLLARAAEALEAEFGIAAGVRRRSRMRIRRRWPRFWKRRRTGWATIIPISILFYAGQMLKPPHPVARAAYALAMAINPNNHARDGGRASSAMEIEAVARSPRCSAGAESSIWAT